MRTLKSTKDLPWAGKGLSRSWEALIYMCRLFEQYKCCKILFTVNRGFWLTWARLAVLSFDSFPLLSRSFGAWLNRHITPIFWPPQEGRRTTSQISDCSNYFTTGIITVKSPFSIRSKNKLCITCTHCRQYGAVGLHRVLCAVYSTDLRL